MGNVSSQQFVPVGPQSFLGLVLLDVLKIRPSASGLKGRRIILSRNLLCSGGAMPRG